MSTIKEELRAGLNAALAEVTAAEGVLETTLRALGGGNRAEKVTVTTDVSDAFARLRRAHEELTRIRDLLDRE